jgi:hypothetical protein
MPALAALLNLGVPGGRVTWSLELLGSLGMLPIDGGVVGVVGNAEFTMPAT